jgi:HSP20 family protein
MRIVRYTQPNTTRSLVPAFGSLGRSPWTGLESEIDRWFESVFDGLDGGTQFPVDLYEDKENAYVRADLPGVNRDDISVEMVNGTLSVTASRKQKTSAGEEESVSFSRSISIPEEVQADKVAATYENGVLTVRLPKREEAKPRKITVDVK